MNLHENQSAFEEMGLEIYNIKETRSRRDYNCYRASYPSIYTPLLSIQNELIVETYIGLLPYPTQLRMVNNYIYQFLHAQQEQELITVYSLEPFEIMTQSVSLNCFPSAVRPTLREI